MIIQYLPYVSRWEYIATIFIEAIIVNASERLESVQVLKRDGYMHYSYYVGIEPYIFLFIMVSPWKQQYRYRYINFQFYSSFAFTANLHIFFLIQSIIIFAESIPTKFEHKNELQQDFFRSYCHDIFTAELHEPARYAPCT